MITRIETTYKGNAVYVSASWIAPRGQYEVGVHFNMEGGSKNIGHKTMYMAPAQWEAWRQQFERLLAAEQWVAGGDAELSYD